MYIYLLLFHLNLMLSLSPITLQSSVGGHVSGQFSVEYSSGELQADNDYGEFPGDHDSGELQADHHNGEIPVEQTADQRSADHYFEAVLAYADAMIEYGRDRYGEVHSPLFSAILDRETMAIPVGERLREIEEIDHAEWGIRRHDRILDGANLLNQQHLFQILDALSVVTGDPSYERAGNEAISWFFRNAQSPATGLMPWGEHAGWSFYENRPSGLDIHEFTMPWIMWEKTFELAPENSVRYARGLWLHQIADHETGAFSRHAGLSEHNPGTGWEFPRHAGFYILAWSEAYYRTGDELFLQAISTLLDFYARHASPDTGAIPAEVDNPRSNSVLIWPQSNLSLAIDLFEGAQRDIPDELAERMRTRGEMTDRVFQSLPHMVGEGGGFVQRSHIHTLDASTLGDDIGEAYTERWGGAYGESATTSIANICLLRYRQTGDAGHRALVLDAARQYLDSEPERGQVLYPGTLGDAIFLMLGAYELTGEQIFLERADHFGSLALEFFFDEVSPLPRATTLHHHYEANINRPETLVMALFNLWAYMSGREGELNLLWADR